MKLDTLKQANAIAEEIDRLEGVVEEWENADSAANVVGRTFAKDVPDAAWVTFRNACKEDLQRKVDAKRIELADL